MYIFAFVIIAENRMEENHKRILRNSAYMYIRMVFIMVISLYTSRVVLEILGVDDFGIYSLIGGIVSIFTVISGSLSGAVQRFLNIGLGEGNMARTKGYFSQSLTIFLVIFAIFLLLGESIGLWFVQNELNIPLGREAATFWVYQFSLAAVLFTILQIPFFGAVVARERMGFFALMGILDVCTRLAVVVLIDIFGTPDNLIFYAGIIAAIQILQTVAYFIYAGSNFEECTFRLQWKRDTVKEMLSFMGLSFWGNTVVTITNQGVNVLLNLFGGTAINAAAGIAKQVNTAVLRLVECINTPIKPQIVKSYAGGDHSQMLFLFERNAKYSLFLMCILLSPLVLENRFILDLWLKDVPDYAVCFTRLVLIESLFYVLSFGMSTIVNATGKLVRMEVYGRIITIAVLPVAYLLLKAGAPIYIPLVISLVAQVIYVAYLFADVNKKTGMGVARFFINVIKPVVILAAALFIACGLGVLFVEEGFLRFILVGTTDVFVAVATIWFFCLDQGEKSFVSGFIQKKLGI